ncbi:MAG: gamma-glutamyl-gamma-aminobutyrate hydrolase family protein, partial [Antricoccus sp.]
PASWGVWRDVPAALIPRAYVDHILQSGGQPLIIPPERDCGEMSGVIAVLDGLIIAGGVDLAPARYGEQPHESIQAERVDRDDCELALVQAAVDADLPLLGICRGMQVMAVAGGGTLIQHVPDEVGHEAHSPVPAVYGRHEVRIQDGSRLAAIIGESIDVASYHHQAVRSHPGYTAVAHAPDGLVEAMEASETSFRIGVQWHPEIDADNRLFAALVAAAG